jgi:hypothetical protein
MKNSLDNHTFLKDVTVVNDGNRRGGLTAVDYSGGGPSRGKGCEGRVFGNEKPRRFVALKEELCHFLS